ncbi:uncharacterized protein ACBT57_008391 [Dama dama]
MNVTWVEGETVREEVEGRVLLNSPPAPGRGGSESELGGDAGPSRDRELQSDADFGAVVTPVWVPAPRCPAHGGLASGPRQAEQDSCGSVCGEAREGEEQTAQDLRRSSHRATVGLFTTESKGKWETGLGLWSWVYRSKRLEITGSKEIRRKLFLISICWSTDLMSL